MADVKQGHVQAISKWIQWLVCGVSVRPLDHCVVGDGRDITEGHGPGIGQPPSWVVLPSQHLHQGITSRLHGVGGSMWPVWWEQHTE